MLLLQEGCKNTRVKSVHKLITPSTRLIIPLAPFVRLRRLPLAPNPSTAIPGIISHRAKRGLPQAALAVVTGCGVVSKLRVTDCGPFNVKELEGEKLQVDADGTAPHVSATVPPKTGFGFNCTL